MSQFFHRFLKTSLIIMKAPNPEPFLLKAAKLLGLSFDLPVDLHSRYTIPMGFLRLRISRRIKPLVQHQVYTSIGSELRVSTWPSSWSCLRITASLRYLMLEVSELSCCGGHRLRFRTCRPFIPQGFNTTSTLHHQLIHFYTLTSNPISSFPSFTFNQYRHTIFLNEDCEHF